VARLGSDRFAIALPQLPAAERLPKLIKSHLDRCIERPFK
jgi:hypothetical protein